MDSRACMSVVIMLQIWRLRWCSLLRRVRCISAQACMVESVKIALTSSDLRVYCANVAEKEKKAVSWIRVSLLVVFNLSRKHVNVMHLTVVFRMDSTRGRTIQRQSSRWRSTLEKMGPSMYNCNIASLHSSFDFFFCYYYKLISYGSQTNEQPPSIYTFLALWTCR